MGARRRRSAFLALPARAAAEPRPWHPARPELSSATPTPAALAALLGGANVSPHLRTTLHVDSLDELWDGVRGGTVRTAARLDAASPRGSADRARTELMHALAEPHRTTTGYDLPLTILIAAR